mmetsp:Transcript_15247/g.29063  ORF Transcript_15247/g.29063 Transcript_15247/m.29063 type:complete len:353 (-) Transcript_15247:32-1090(-)
MVPMLRSNPILLAQPTALYSRMNISTPLLVLTLILGLLPDISLAFVLTAPFHARLYSAGTTSIPTIKKRSGQQFHALSKSSCHRQTSLSYKNDHDDTSATDLGAIIKHPLFSDSNVHVQKFPIRSPNIWDSLLPPVDVLASVLGVGSSKQLRKGVIGKDTTVEFDQAQVGAKKLLDGCGLSNDTKGYKDAMDLLTNVLSFYQDIVSYGYGKNLTCRARIVSTRGHVGTKCPRWHADHVPVRLVMSLVGPGCDFVPERLNGGEAIDAVLVDREALNGLDMDDTYAANRIIVPNENGISHSSAGDAVLLMGREWEHYRGTETHKAGHLHAAVHKSPNLNPFEGRVLLVIDVITR